MKESDKDTVGTLLIVFVVLMAVACVLSNGHVGCEVRIRSHDANDNHPTTQEAMNRD